MQPQSELTALVISPDRELAQQFASTLPSTRAFHILAEMKSYPAAPALDIRLRQLRPDLVFLDLSTDLDVASGLIEFVAAIRPPVYVVGLHKQNDSEAILQSLRTRGRPNPLRAVRHRKSRSARRSGALRGSAQAAQ